MKIAVLGATGMLGQMVVRVLKQTRHTVTGLMHQELDALIFTAADTTLLGYDYIVNCIGLTNKHIDEERPQDVEKAIRINALFPHELAKLKIPVIQIATDCAFDHDTYGMTKRLGEVNQLNVANIRCSIIGPGNPLGLLDWFLEQEQGAIVEGYPHLWNGVTTLAFAKLCAGIIDHHQGFKRVPFMVYSGHFTPFDVIKKIHLLRLFARYYDREDIAIVTKNIKPINKAIDAGNPWYWEAAGYPERPSIEELVSELRAECM